MRPLDQSKACEGSSFLISAVAALAALAAGCGGDLPVASHLERARVLGARVQVTTGAAAAPGRADALPGETAAVEWLVAAPAAPPSLAWAFGVCTAIDGMCEDGPGMPVEGTGAPVVAAFTAPPAIDDTRRPLMVGVVCAGGAPALDASGLPGCDAATDSANVTRFQIPMVAIVEEANHHPNLGDDAVELEGVAWTAVPAGDAGGPCDAAAGLPVVQAGAGELHLRVVSDANDREAFVREAGRAPELEALQLSMFATAGELDGQYALVDTTDTRPDADLKGKWTPPAAKDVPAGGLVVHFHFVLRDGRGGLDWAHRALCVAP
jgi:hypothetical protein